MPGRAAFEHFLSAQDDGGYETALEELRDGKKRSHWMWFVFPQLEGLGSSANARNFGLSGKAEARAYAEHEDLGERLYEATEAMLDWAGTMSAEDILGATDAMKFRSSMTLFETCCSDREVFAQALDAFFDGERDTLTLEKLQSISAPT